MTDENAPRGKGNEGESDPDNAVFKRAIDNIFKKVAKRGKADAEDAARSGRKARRRADDAGKRQRRRKRDQ